MSVPRRSFLAAIGIVAAACAAPVFLAADEVANLKVQLQSKLRARRPQDFAFINLVVTKVNLGELPLPIVNAAYNWAMKKQPYPYPYFEEALKRLARDIGVDLGPPTS